MKRILLWLILAPVLLVLPGSRAGELKRLLGVFSDTVALVSERVGALEVVLPAGFDTGLLGRGKGRSAADWQGLGVRSADGRALALIVQPQARRALAHLLRQRAAHCLVLSIAELPANQPVEVVGVIGGPKSALPDHSGEVLAA